MAEPRIFIFDMDHTLINADCDVTWKSYGVKHGIAPADALERANAFFDQYNAGTLDPQEFMNFQFSEFIGNTPEEMAVHAKRHFEEFILPHYYEKGKKVVDSLLARQVPVAILTSTNDVLARPVADFFGIETVMGTRLEVEHGVYTGRIVGEYGAGPGKIAPATAFAERHGATLADVEYYGDSINDRNILEAVGFPVAANPSAALRELAEAKQWRIVNFGA